MKKRFGDDRVCFVKCDVTKEEEFKNLFDKAEEFFKVRCIDILVNNAGINTNLGWRKCMDVNIMAVMMGLEMAMDRMIKTGRSDHQERACFMAFSHFDEACYCNSVSNIRERLSHKKPDFHLDHQHGIHGGNGSRFWSGDDWIFRVQEWSRGTH